jgi:hypothetical protein
VFSTIRLNIPTWSVQVSLAYQFDGLRAEATRLVAIQQKQLTAREALKNPCSTKPSAGSCETNLPAAVMMTALTAITRLTPLTPLFPSIPSIPSPHPPAMMEVKG